MFKVILLCILLVVTNGKNNKPRDLADEAEEQLQELNSIVTGEILFAHDEIGNKRTEFGTNSQNVAQNGGVDVQQEWGSVNSELTNIKDLANSVNADISSCTNVREGVLNRLPGDYIQRINICIEGINIEATRITTNAVYTVDVIINKVNQLDFQIRQCRRDLLCISPLVTEMQLDKIRLPQNIKTEVQAADGVMTTLRVSVGSCSDDNVANFAAEAYSILSDITECANRVIG